MDRSQQYRYWRVWRIMLYLFNALVRKISRTGRISERTTRNLSTFKPCALNRQSFWFDERFLWFSHEMLHLIWISQSVEIYTVFYTYMYQWSNRTDQCTEPNHAGPHNLYNCTLARIQDFGQGGAINF